MRDQCVELLSHLDDAFDRTREQVHVRSAAQGFGLGADGTSRLAPEAMGVSKARPGELRPSSETLLEYALYQRYRPESSTEMTPWRYIVHRQVPLYNKADSEGWGEIDLLGLTEPGEPVIVELKKASSHDTPLHALLEAACYAVSLRQNWALLSAEIAGHYRGLHVVPQPDAVLVVLLAPATYWSEWRRWSTCGGGVPADTQDAFASLCMGFAARKLPVLTATAQHPESWDERTPLSADEVSITDVQPVPG